jgi:hypothetical protein
MRQIVLAPIRPDYGALLLIKIEQRRPGPGGDRKIYGNRRHPHAPFLSYQRNRLHICNPSLVHQFTRAHLQKCTVFGDLSSRLIDLRAMTHSSAIAAPECHDRIRRALFPAGVPNLRVLLPSLARHYRIGS